MVCEAFEWRLVHSRVFDKIFSLDQIGSGQAMGELMYFKLVQPNLNRNFIVF